MSRSRVSLSSADSHASLAHAAKHARPTRVGLVLACLASAALAFALGRATAPDRRAHGPPAPASAAGGTGGAAVPTLANSRKPVDSGTKPSAPDAPGAASDRQAEIIRMLQRFKSGGELTDLNGEFLSLIGWVSSANQDDLAVFIALGKEILAGQDSKQTFILPLAFTRWTELDPAAAFDAYLALDETERSQEVTRILFDGWILQGSPREAIDHALALQRTSTGQSSPEDGIVGEMLGKLFKKDPTQARQIAEEFARSNDPHEQNAAAQSAGNLVTEMIHQQGPEATLAWIENWPAAADRNKLRHQAMNELLNGDEASQRAGMEILSRLPEPDPYTLERVARQKVQTNAAEAQAWASAMPAGSTRLSAVEKVTEALQATHQLTGAAQWLSTQPVHPDFDPAYTQMAVEVFHNAGDFPTALQWAKRVSNSEAAAQVQSQLIERWLSLEPERALQVLGPAMEKDLLARP